MFPLVVNCPDSTFKISVISIEVFTITPLLLAIVKFARSPLIKSAGIVCADCPEKFNSELAELPFIKAPVPAVIVP